MTSGATEAIFDAVLAVVRPGDEVIVLDPCYDCYEPAIDLAGGVRGARAARSGRFLASTGAWLRAAITPKTRMILINIAAQPVRRDAGRRRTCTNSSN